MSMLCVSERRRKYEQQKRENPKLHIDEPEPAVSSTRHFTSSCPSLHLTHTSDILALALSLLIIFIILLFKKKVFSSYVEHHHPFTYSYTI